MQWSLSGLRRGTWKPRDVLDILILNWCILNCVYNVLTSVKKKKKKDGDVEGVLESVMPSRAYRNCVITDEKCNILSLKESPSLSAH